MEAVLETRTKRWTYEDYARLDDDRRFVMKEYWIGDPANKTLEILALQQGSYRLHSFVQSAGKINSLVLPDLKFDLSEIQ